MIRAHELTAAIQWHEGMLLTPHHFQQLTRLQEEQLTYHLQAASPYHWGVVHLAFDRVLLVNGLLRVLDLEAILPDGLVVSHEARQGESGLELDLRPHADALKERPMKVFLVVPVRRNPYQVSRGTLERFDAYEGPQVMDETTGNGGVSIPRLKPRVALMLTETPPEKYVSLPIAQVRYQQDGYALTAYLPPQLGVATGSPLWQMGTTVARTLREKASFLAEQVRSPSMGSDDPQMLLRRMQVQGMVGGLPMFEALLNTGRTHPFALYLGFCHLAGQVAVLGHPLVPPIFPTYDHGDLRRTYEAVQAFIDEELTQGIQQSHQAYVFNRRSRLFYLRYEPSWADQPLLLGVRVRSGMSEADAVRWMQHTLIGGESVVSKLRERRVLGLAREKVERADGLLPGPGVVFFQVTPDAALARPGENLLLVPGLDRSQEDDPLEVILYIKTTSTPQATPSAT